VGRYVAITEVTTWSIPGGFRRLEFRVTMTAVNSRLAQVLRYLERDGVTEVVLRVGQPVSMRTAKGPTDVTARALTSEQLDAIVRDTELSLLMASRIQDAVVELQSGTLRAVARVTRRDDGIAVTLTRAALPPPPRTEPPSEFDVDLEIEPPVENESALAPEPPVRRSVAIPRPVHGVPSSPPMPGPPPLRLGIDLDLSLDDMPDSVDHGSAPAPVRPPVQRDDNPAVQRIGSHTGSDRQDRQHLRPSAGAFQRVDLRDARAPTPKPDLAESTDDSSAWADIDLAPPSRKR